MILASDACIQVLLAAKRLSVDGTFTTMPLPFKQLFVVMGTTDNNITVPCVFALLPDKSFETYLAMFRRIEGLHPDMFKGKDAIHIPTVIHFKSIFVAFSPLYLYN